MSQRVQTTSVAFACAVLVSGTLVTGCGSTADTPAQPPESAARATRADGAAPAALRLPAALRGTEWRLVEFQSMDDAIGTKRPDDANLYTMRLNADGTVAMRLNCNRASGSWQAQAGPEGTSGQFTFGPLASTQALCPPPSMDEQLRAQAPFVRSYLLENGQLFLSLMADGGIILWEPAAQPSGSAAPVK